MGLEEHNRDLQGFKSLGGEQHHPRYFFERGGRTRGEGICFSFQGPEDFTWTSRALSVINLQLGGTVPPQGDYYDLLMEAVNLLDSWSPGERWYQLLRDTTSGTARVVSFLHGGPHRTLIATITVVTLGRKRHLVVFLDDYNRPHPNPVVYGAYVRDTLLLNGIQVGGRINQKFYNLNP